MEITKVLAEWGPVIGLVWPPLVGWLWWSIRQKFVQKEDLSPLVERVTLLEQSVPDEGTLLDLRLGMQEMRGELRTVDARLEGVQGAIAAIRNNLDMLMQHHIDGGKR